MPRIVCKACSGVVYDSWRPFSSLPRSCCLCGCSDYVVEERKKFSRIFGRKGMVRIFLGSLFRQSFI